MTEIFRGSVDRRVPHAVQLRVDVPLLLERANVTLTGPGIKDSVRMNLPDVALMQRNSMLYPLGVDLFFTCGSEVSALPRSTQIQAEGSAVAEGR